MLGFQFVAAAAMLLCAAGGAAAAPRYSVTLLDNAVRDSAAFAINNAGVAAGAHLLADAEWRTSFLWNAGQKTMLPTSMHAPSAISDAGHVVGSSDLQFQSGGRILITGQYYYKGSLSTVPNAFEADTTSGTWHSFTLPAGINSAGTMVVNQQTNVIDGTYLVREGQITILPLRYAKAINEAGQVAGAAMVAQESHAVLYEDGRVIDLGALPSDVDGASSIATDLNDAGTVVGSSDFGFGSQARYHSFIYRDGAMAPLGDITVRNWANAVNNHGDVVGGFRDDMSNDGEHAYLYKDGVQYDLDTLIGGGWRMDLATDINDSGQIVGRACQGGISCFAVLLSPVPEPATWGMLLGGLAVLAAGRRGRMHLSS